MSRPLLVTDCDEVLLHMVRPFSEWLDRRHDIAFALEGNPFVQSMTRRGSDEAIAEEEVWALLGGFFDTEMDSQQPIVGALEAMAEIQRDADVVVLTNLTDERNEARTEQLRKLGFEAPVYTNQGPKGGALKSIVEEHGASHVLFIDDLAQHHKSAKAEVPHVHRLHLCGEPSIAPHIPCAHEKGHAHARIDSWDEALPYILANLHSGE
ncbi:HAD family hydrolase [Aurantiacibacter aquimixticola]|uniref:HAD family hydrolase n=1 Tax=Aurantiacibacter aquimixticola TaxID=1958945 RepID=A0A419RV85_9SPHN|nr:HAD family hydrolase [Aurantiacibacter aquimixticola]RJY09703.1 HAD family hydrolase [Aurantiacibacter aquimixticola]